MSQSELPLRLRDSHSIERRDSDNAARPPSNIHCQSQYPSDMDDSQEAAFNCGGYRYHQYTFGERDMVWVNWINEDEPEDEKTFSDEMSVSDDESTPPESDREFFEHEDGSFSGTADERSDASSMSEHTTDGVSKEEDDEEGSLTSLTGDDRPLTSEDILQLKRSALLTYSAEQFVQLPPFRMYLLGLNKEKLLSILKEHWELEEAEAKVAKVFYLTYRHPSMEIQKILNESCKKKHGAVI
ncbi:hypothetical protein BJX61DRAFT_398463 [Aspergillus egyptiacus]|nr:hypothetical protein BJX61DRAFT_398463 [Aspergillus egyptiacus]